MGDSDRLFSGSCDFTAGAATPDQIPAPSLPEIAFSGRSNVGKSSLINALTGRKALARISRTPGRTQQLNFFDIGGRFMIVDMPGYGYAKVSREQKELWDHLIGGYLRDRPTLRCVFVLVDARHGLKDSDHDLLAMLDEAGVPSRIVLTKADKAEVTEELLSSVREGLEKHPAVFPEPLLTSAAEKTGIAALRGAIGDLLP